MLFEVPEDIEKLKQLQYFNIKSNKISKLPYCLSNLSKLKYLNA